MSFEACTPCDTRRRFTSILGAAEFAEASTPPSTPPALPAGPTPPITPTLELTGGGASSSTIFLILSGIFVGVRSAPSMMSVLTFFTTTVGVGGGGGGGGGGGATKVVSIAFAGSASV